MLLQYHLLPPTTTLLLLLPLLLLLLLLLLLRLRPFRHMDGAVLQTVDYFAYPSPHYRIINALSSGLLLLLFYAVDVNLSKVSLAPSEPQLRRDFRSAPLPVQEI